MKKLVTTELNDLFVDTINRFTYDLINKNDDEIEYEVLEEFDTEVVSFLHESSLNLLLENRYINEIIKELCLKLRNLYLAISDEKRNAESIRKDTQWSEILNLSDMIREKKKEFDLNKTHIGK